MSQSTPTTHLNLSPTLNGAGEDVAMGPSTNNAVFMECLASEFTGGTGRIVPLPE